MPYRQHDDQHFGGVKHAGYKDDECNSAHLVEKKRRLSILHRILPRLLWTPGREHNFTDATCSLRMQVFVHLTSLFPRN